MEGWIYPYTSSSARFWLSYAVSGNVNCLLLDTAFGVTNQWVHYAVTYTGGVTTSYVNGQAHDFLNAGFCGSYAPGALVLGQKQGSVGGGFVVGQAGQVRVDSLRLHKFLVNALTLQGLVNKDCIGAFDWAINFAVASLRLDEANRNHLLGSEFLDERNCGAAGQAASGTLIRTDQGCSSSCCCEDLCRTEPNCIAYAFITTSKACNLRSTNTMSNSASTTISGTVPTGRSLVPMTEIEYGPVVNSNPSFEDTLPSGTYAHLGWDPSNNIQSWTKMLHVVLIAKNFHDSSSRLPNGFWGTTDSGSNQIVALALTSSSISQSVPTVANKWYRIKLRVARMALSSSSCSAIPHFRTLNANKAPTTPVNARLLNVWDRLCTSSESAATVCYPSTTYTAAAADCASQGARLCSWDVIQSGSLYGTGCGYDVQWQWTRDACAGGHYKAKQDHTRVCTADSSSNYYRCCADKYDHISGATDQIAIYANGSPVYSKVAVPSTSWTEVETYFQALGSVTSVRIANTYGDTPVTLPGGTYPASPKYHPVLIDDILVEPLSHPGNDLVFGTGVNTIMSGMTSCAYLSFQCYPSSHQCGCRFRLHNSPGTGQYTMRCVSPPPPDASHHVR